MAFEDVGQHHQQQPQLQQSLQQQPTMPEAWLAALTNLREEGGQGGRSSISLTGGRSRQLPSAAAAAANGATTQQHDHQDAGLSQLKQAFAQQLMMQHSSAGDELL
jgi:aspartate/methionine/tyrosine aminotransferase